MPKFLKYGAYLFVLPVLTRILTPEDFGILALSMAFPMIATSVVTAGLSSSIARFYFEYRKDEIKLNALYFSSQLYLFTMLIVSALAVYTARNYVSELVLGRSDLGIAIFVAYLAVYMDKINAFFLLIYQNMEQAAVHSFFLILQTTVNITSSLFFILYLKMSYMGMIYGSLCGTFTAFMGLTVYFNRNIKIDFSSAILIENLKYGIQVVPKSFTGLINKYFDKFMLNEMLSMSAVGIYNIGQTVANTLFVLMGNVSQVFDPIYYREVFDRGKDASYDVGKIFSSFAYITILPIVIAMLFAREILYIVAPPSYYGAIDVMVLLAAGIATQTFGMTVGVQYAYSKKPFWIFPITVAGTIMNVLCNIWLIPEYGLMGAAAATVVSTAVTNIILVYVGLKLYEIKYEWRLIAVVFAYVYAAMGAVLYLQSVEMSYEVVYFFKVVFFILYLFIGMKAKIVSKGSVKKVFNAIFRHSKQKEA